MVYDLGDSFPFDFEPNGIPFGSKSKGKLTPRSYPIHCERQWKYSFLSVYHTIAHHRTSRKHSSTICYHEYKQTELKRASCDMCSRGFAILSIAK